ncbi:MAG: hypothetical protein EON95_06880 [Caulobacteraceae bacterium]|nr:MAG: hypothetical protein EON95_06880 [Caulobacteraceae bacterium]
MTAGLEKHRRMALRRDVGNRVPAAPARTSAAAAASYLHPYACFRCRRSFKRASTTAAVLTCPRCAGPAIGLTRKFKPPPHDDLKQWAKVEALVRHGFLFWSLDEPYPETLAEVPAFAARHADHLGRMRKAMPQAFVAIEAAKNRPPV